jgi:hypothetical protein
MKKTLVILCGILMFATVIGCREYEEKDAAEPIITTWLPGETFKVVKPVKKVDELEMGWVIVERIKNGDLYSVMVFPIRDILVGSTVEVVEVRYYHTIMTPHWFLMVR